MSGAGAPGILKGKVKQHIQKIKKNEKKRIKKYRIIFYSRKILKLQ